MGFLIRNVVRLFNNIPLAAMLIQNFLIGIVFYSLLYYLPIYYQTARRMGLLASAALLIPVVVPQAIASALSGQYISRRKRYGEVLWTGYICWVLGTGLHCIFSSTTPIVAIAFILIVEGTGVGLVFQPGEFPIGCTRNLADHLCLRSSRGSSTFPKTRSRRGYQCP